MISYSSTYRSKQSELLDDFELQGADMIAMLNDLSRVNQWLGGMNTTLSALNDLLGHTAKDTQHALLDIGCGDGEMLRNCAQWGKKHGRNLRLIGVDVNPHILKEAQKTADTTDGMQLLSMNIFDTSAKLPEFDVALCTLFIHHYPEDQIVLLLNRLLSQSKVGIVVNDLHRSRWAFHLFGMFSKLFLRSKIAKHDGLVSIARGFKRKELKHLSEQIEGVHRIRWRWAFRYQWIIKKSVQTPKSK
ncbi:MAG: methyltransferase domain-containing protein [Bacteroidota bacterium]